MVSEKSTLTLPPAQEHLINVQDKEAQRIAEFQNLLPLLAIAPLYAEIDLKSKDPASETGKRFVIENNFGMPTFFAVPEIANELQEGLVSFEPLVSRGKASRNGVFFGAFHFTDGSQLEVAVKPHPIGSEDKLGFREAEVACLKDYFTNVAAQKAKFEGLTPVGMILNEEGMPYSITLLDEALTTQDSTDWTEFYKEGHETAGMREMWGKVASVVALLHDTGDCVHGDLEARNIAANPDGHVFLIDWEFGQVTTAPSIDIEERFGKSLIDIKALMVSMARPSNLPYNQRPGIGLFTHNKGLWWDGFKDIFFDEYASWRLAMAGQGKHHTKKVRETEEELQQLEHFLQNEMARQQAQFGHAAEQA